MAAAAPEAAVAPATSAQEYLYENGRRFANPKFNSSYTLPNDDAEGARLDRQHEQFLFMLNGSLFRAPLKVEELKEVVDIGTGTGIWAEDFAKRYPKTSVTGVDISPIARESRIANLTFSQGDFTSSSTWSALPPSISYIHGRYIAVGVRDWSLVARNCYDALAPGGWMEMTELLFPMKCDDGSASPDGPMLRWSTGMVDGGAALGVDMTSARTIAGVLEATGFEDIKTESYKWPNNPWSDDPVLKAIGESQQYNFANGLEGFTIGLFTRGLGWSKEKVDAFLVEVRAKISDPSEHVYMPILVVYGRKPLA